ncbi:MAG TPA: FG-GAP-like repeat-containing protein [Candidatus Kapabacteria bacterium]|nr:FG-GAP-like repeat-containing protein [Candidatus Kapabacteria bacterium]
MNHTFRSLTAAAACGLALGLLAAPSPLNAFPSFTDAGAGLTGVHHGSVLWGDFDNDGYLDVFETGETSPILGTFADVYRNTYPTLPFAAQGFSLPGVSSGSERSRSAWGDFDSDGDLDLIVTGVSGTSSIMTLYRNDGTSFTAETISPSAFPGVAFSSVAWADYDNDGDLDLFVEGYRNIGGNFTTIYRNDGSGGVGTWKFTDITAGFDRLMGGDAAFADYDNDGDMDLLVTGYQFTFASPETRLYRNDGGVFVNSGIVLPAIGESSVCWGDFNNDGYMDIAMQGSNSAGTPIQQVYLNGGGTSFSLSWSGTGVYNGSLAIGDYDNDGKLDLVSTGIPIGGFPTPTTNVYVGNGLGTFTADPSTGLNDLYEGQSSFGDFNHDGRLDLLHSGNDAYPTGSSFSRVYNNTKTGVPANNVPTAPLTPFVAALSWTSITISWGAGSDVETPTNALQYNLVVRDVTAGTTVMTPEADLSTGARRVAALGNVNHNLSWTVNNLIPGHTYSYCVQTIDQAFAPSVWACGANVTTPLFGPNVTIRDCIADNGTEPSTGNCGTVMWASPDIYVRNQPDGFVNQVHQSPIAGQPNYVYVRLKNNGVSSLGSGRVYVYFAKASTGLIWQKHWVNDYSGTIVYGDEVHPAGYADVTFLPVGSTVIKEILWDPVPDPANYSDPDAHHFCLVARFVADSDPMAVLEGTSIYDNVKNNNNIAWKNVSILNVAHRIGPIGIYNTTAARVDARLRLTVPENEGGDPILNHAKIKLDLGADLFRLWQDGGRQGDGIVPVNDQPDNTAVWIVAPTAEIRGLTFDEDARFTAHVEVVFPDQVDKNLAGQLFHWEMAQYEGQRDEPVGGEEYEIEMPANNGDGGPANKRAVTGQGTLGAVMNLDAHPNPAAAFTAITYTLPMDGNVSLAVFDIAGRLVRELVTDAFQTTGSYEVPWDGTAANGQPVANGTYFYRLSTPAGSAQKQLKIMH